MSTRKTSVASPAPRQRTAQAARRSGPIAAAQAKAHLLSIMEEVSQNGIPVIITRRGKPLVQIAPLDPMPPAPDIFGCMKGTVTITGDIVGPEPDEWEAMQ